MAGEHNKENIEVCVAVEADYWYGDEEGERTEEAIEDLYQKLFSTPNTMGSKAKTGSVAERKEKRANKAAMSIWADIKENPGSPQGPLTLAAISQAILVGADFSAPEDCQAFFEFMRHNNAFQKLFNYFVFERAKGSSVNVENDLLTFFERPRTDSCSSNQEEAFDYESNESSASNESDVSDEEEVTSDTDELEEKSNNDTKIPLKSISVEGVFLKGMRLNIPTESVMKVLTEDSAIEIPAHGDSATLSHVPDEILRLQQSWLPSGQPGLQAKLLEAMRKEETFVLALFEAIPDLTKKLSDTYLRELAFHYPGVVIAAASGFESAPDRLSRAFQEDLFHTQEWFERLLAQPMQGAGDLMGLYTDHVIEPAAFVQQSDRSTVKSAKMRSVSTFIADAIQYFARHSSHIVNNIFEKIADRRFSAEEKSRVRDRELELRYRLYHPLTIKSMEAFWLNHFDAFQCAAGKDDQYLVHLLAHMNDPIGFVTKMLVNACLNEKVDEAKACQDYFFSRLGKIMPVLGKIPGKRAQKDRNNLLSKRFARKKESISVKLKLRECIDRLIDAYKKSGNDPSDALLTMLDDDVTRGKCQLSPEQVKILLQRETNQPNEARRFNSRFEIIIARDDYLFNCLMPAALDEERAMQLHYPALFARFDINKDIKKHGSLKAYIHGIEDVSSLTMRKAYLIAAKDQYWLEIDPYTLYPLPAFFHWLNSDWFKGFFEEQEKKLARVSPLFQMRLDWERGRVSCDRKTEMSFEECIGMLQDQHIWKQSDQPHLAAEAKAEFAALMADLGRGVSILDNKTLRDLLDSEGEAYTPYGLAIIDSPAHFEAFLAQVNTPEKATRVRNFILSSAALEKITPEQAFRLMTRDECPVMDQKSSQVSCYGLAEQIILKRPSLLADIVSNTMLREKLSGTPEVLMELVTTLLGSNHPLLHRLLSDLTVISGQYSQVQLDQDVGRIVTNQSIIHKLSVRELYKIRSVSQPVFDRLMSNRGLREKMSAELFTKKSRLAHDDLVGLEALFKNQPELLYNIISDLTVEEMNSHARYGESLNLAQVLSEGSSQNNYDLDIYGLRPQWPGQQHPFFVYMIESGISIDNDLGLMVRCMQSENKALAVMMRDVLRNKLGDNGEAAHRLLTSLLIRPECDEKMVEFIMRSDNGLDRNVKKVLCDLKYIDSCLNTRQKEFESSQTAEIIWGKLLGGSSATMMSPVEDFIVNELPRSITNAASIQLGLKFSEVYRLRKSACVTSQLANQRNSFIGGASSSCYSKETQKPALNVKSSCSTSALEVKGMF
jgi:hypothetical protein